MRYPESRMSLDATMPSSLQSWLGHELEMRGIDAMIYTRYILSILQHDTMELDYIDAFPNQLPTKKQMKIKGKARGKSKSRKSHGFTEDTDELKKTAAVECLLSVTDEDSGIEDLVEELCVKLKELGTDKESSPKSSSPKRKKGSIASSPGDPTQKYYAAFPSLYGKTTATSVSLPVTCTSPSVWDSRKKVVGQDNQNNNKNNTPSPCCTSKQYETDEHDNYPPKQDTQGGKERKSDINAHRRKKECDKNENEKCGVSGVSREGRGTAKSHGELKPIVTFKVRSGERRKYSPRPDSRNKRSPGVAREKTRNRVETVRPTFILPRVPVTSKSPSSLEPNVRQQQMSQLRDTIERRLSEKKLSMINEPSAFSHFSKPFPKVRHSSQTSNSEYAIECEDEHWYTKPLQMLSSDSPVPAQPLYLRRPSSDVDFKPIATGNNQESLQPKNTTDFPQDDVTLDCFNKVVYNPVFESAESTDLVSGIMTRYLSSEDGESDASPTAENVSFALDYPKDHLGATLLYGWEGDIDTSQLDSVFVEDDTGSDAIDKLLTMFTELRSANDEKEAGDAEPEEHDDCSHRSRFMSMFQKNEELGIKHLEKKYEMFTNNSAENELPCGVIDSTQPSDLACMPLLVETVTSEEYGSVLPWHGQTWSSQPSFLTGIRHPDWNSPIFPTNYFNGTFSPSDFWNAYPQSMHGLFFPFHVHTACAHPLPFGEPLRHLWDVNLCQFRPSLTESSPINFAIHGIYGTSPPAPQGLLKICDSLDYNTVDLRCAELATPNLAGSTTHMSSSKGLWNDTHWGLLSNCGDSQATVMPHMTTSTSTDSFFLNSGPGREKTCKVKLLYRQRSWSFDDGQCSADAISSVYSSPSTRAYIDGMGPENLHDDLLFSPETHFRPIQTSTSGSPEDKRNKKQGDSPVPDGYQSFNHGSNKTAFIPKFRLQQGMEKYAQTDQECATPSVEGQDNLEPEVTPSKGTCSPGFDVLTYFSDTSSDCDDPLQFSLDLDEAPDESDLSSLAETLTQNAINKLMEDSSLDVEVDGDIGRAPSLSQSKFARLWKDPGPYLLAPGKRPSKIPGCSSNSDIANMVAEHHKDVTEVPARNCTQVIATASEKVNTDILKSSEDGVKGSSTLDDRSDPTWSDARVDEYSAKLSIPNISALWNIESVPEQASPLVRLRREGSIWSVGSESESDAIVPLWTYEPSEDDAKSFNFPQDCGDGVSGGEKTAGSHLDADKKASPVPAVYSSELERKWLHSDIPCKVQVPRRDKRGNSIEPKKKPCSFFMEGHCKKADCRFAHDMTHVTCRYWEQGSCFKGITCPFLHGYHSVSEQSGMIHHAGPVMPGKGAPNGNSGRNKLRKARCSPRRMMQPSYHIQHRPGNRRRMLKPLMDDIKAAKK